MNPVFVGVGQEYGPSDPPPSDWNAAIDIGRALTDGHRWLILTDTNYPMRTPVDLDQYATNRTLRIDGAGAHLTHFNQAWPIPSLLVGGAGWTLEFEGLHFAGDPTHGTPGDMLCDFAEFTAVEFSNCAWEDGVGLGLRLRCQPGSAAVGNVTLTNCQFRNNQGGGVELDHVGQIAMVGGTVEWNSQGVVGTGLRIKGPGTPGRSTGLLHGVHCELAGENGYWAMELEDVHGMRVLDCYLYLSRVRLTGNTSECYIDNNARWDHSEIDDETGQFNTITARNHDIETFPFDGCPNT